jgi:hypothetical protein
MNIAEIEIELRDLVGRPFDANEFPFAFLTIYDAAKATVTKLRQGAANLAQVPGEVLLKNKLFFRATSNGQAAQALDEIEADPLTARHRPRFLVTTDGREVYARDTKADQTLDIAFGSLNDRFDFFLPLAGIERHEGVAENPADIKATGRLAKLYDAILEGNPDWLEVHGTHELNLFMTRMLFCFFAEDTSIFPDGLFTSTVLSLTREDGSDTSQVLTTVFRAMNTPDSARAGQPDFARRFPFVNGGLFSADAAIPGFSKRARRLLRECGDLQWRDINPDIFGSMIQAVVEPGLRGDMGMHYTSVPNIMKVLQPLFVLSLEEEFEAARDSEQKLNRLLQRLYKIRVFDPACGSGNFLIIAYRELRRIETRVFQRLQELTRQTALPMSGVHLTQFSGIELADFAAETAKLSLWIAEYQVNAQFRHTFGSAPPALPLQEGGAIIQGNALQLDWGRVGPNGADNEIYVVGNPPYLGRAQQTSDQKGDILRVFGGITTNFKKLDYVSCWLLKAADYCAATRAQSAFVTTSSICQGEQVALLWPLVLEREVEIGFAHQSFKWRNNAAKNAGVACVVIGLRVKQRRPKVLYAGEHARAVNNISPYLTDGPDLIVYPVSNSKTDKPIMTFGNMARDDGNLIISRRERDEILRDSPEAETFIRPFVGSQEFIKGIERWCIWIEEKRVDEALAIPELRRRISAVRQFRLESDASSTVEFAKRAYRFVQIQGFGKEAIVIPRHFSEERRYLTVGMVPETSIIGDSAFAIYSPPPYLLAILSSRLHAVWTSAVGGQLETRLRYSNTLVYNTYPLPDLSKEQQGILEDHSIAILNTREQYVGKTIAEIYDADAMPEDLRAVHEALDNDLEMMTAGKILRTDAERLEYLFKRYAIKAAKSGAAKGISKSTKAA